MGWKRWAVVAILAVAAVKAPHTVMALGHQIAASVATFWDALGMH